MEPALIRTITITTVATTLFTIAKLFQGTEYFWYLFGFGWLFMALNFKLILRDFYQKKDDE